MNKTLYIGPYRQRDPIGLLSQSMLINLDENATIDLYARPIYLDPEYNTNAIADTVSKIELKSDNTEFDTIIQHLPIDYAQRIDCIKNNILIPILDDQELSDDYYNKLIKFNKIYIDNKQDYIKLTQFSGPKLTKIVSLVDYQKHLIVKNNGKFDIGVLNNTKKLYHITNYKQNIRSVHQIILSYIKNIKYSIVNNLSLILFVLDVNQSDKSILDKFITRCYDDAGCKYAVNRIVIAPITSDINNICIAHNTGNAYISLNDYGSDSINIKLANNLKKDIISFEHKYHLSFSNRFNITQDYLSIARSDDVVNTSIRNYMSNGSLLTDHIKTKQTSILNTLNLF